MAADLEYRGRLIPLEIGESIMSEAYEYGEDFDDDEELDEEDMIRMEIMEAEANEVWLEEPADEDEDSNAWQEKMEKMEQMKRLAGLL